jgi:hypothetical protein
LWDEKARLFATIYQHEHYSEHSQLLAIFRRDLGAPQPMKAASKHRAQTAARLDLARTTIYFTHYLFETYRCAGVVDHFFERMQGWFELKAQGLKTPSKCRSHTLRLPRVGRASAVPLLRDAAGYSSR